MDSTNDKKKHIFFGKFVQQLSKVEYQENMNRGTFGFPLAQDTPESLATLSALSASILPSTEGLLLTAAAMIWKEVPWRSF